MVKKALSLAVFLGVAVPVSTAAQSAIARFEGGIGVVPVRAGPAPNVVRGTNPGGVPWVIAELSATVSRSGRIRVDGEGLLLAGGDNIGRPAAPGVVLRVQAKLFCGAEVFLSGAVDVEADGDFRIDEFLTPAPPDPCVNSVLLIVSAVNTPNGNWFAAGIPRE